MGVKDLWNIISPSCERKPLYEIQGKAIAIDLSGWVVDSQSIVDNVIQPKMHLRNLFFRTAFLLMNDVYPVFVLEGTAPTLKHKTLAKRNEIRNGTQQKKTSRRGGRGNFNKILKECESMLKYMGISCIRGQGEAEAMCALLNAEGLVDGCISQDSDCFLYGAKVVYRNFCTSAQGNRGTTGGSIDEYNIEKIERLFQLGRNKMIALALICGCDYDEGINGVGKEAALKLFKLVSESDIIERMKSWRTDSTFTRMETELSNPNICTTCGHNGKMRSHIKTGCRDCGTSTKCNDSYKEKRILISNELSIRKKALLVDNFPSEELINEFLHHKDSVPTNLDLKWKTPQVSKFVTFMEMYVLWEPEYAYAKILPLLTRWQVRNLAEIPDDRRLTMRNLLIPEKIKKPRNIKGIATYEVVWEDKEGIFKGMTLACISDKENDSEEPPASPTELATLEPQHLFQKCYPLLVEEFENARLAKKKKPAKPRAKKAKATEEATGEKIEKKKAQRRPRKPKTTEVANNRKMDEFMKVNLQTLEDSFDALTITPKRKKKTDDVVDSVIKSPSEAETNSPPFCDLEAERLNRILNGSLLRMFNELTPEDFPSEPEDQDMSVMIIDNVCSKSQANVSLPGIQSPHYDFEPKFDPHSEYDLKTEVDSNSTLHFKPKSEFEPELDSKLDFEPFDLGSKSKLEPKFEIDPELHLEFDSSMQYGQNCNSTGKPEENLKKEPINSPVIPEKSMNESENADCTLKRIIDSYKNAANHRTKPISLIKSPNVFAIKKPRKKFDFLNFTYERENSPEPKINYKISADCIQQSTRISNLLNSKSPDQDDSMERFDRMNASVERYLFGRKFKDPENPENSKTTVPDILEAPEQNNLEIEDENVSKSKNRYSVKTLDQKDFAKKINQTESAKKGNRKDSGKNKNRINFSLERTLHLQNLSRNLKTSVASTSDESVFKKTEENDFEEDVDSLNSSLERLRFAQPPNFQIHEIENSGFFNLSKIKPENKLTDSINVENSICELLPIVQSSEDNAKNSEINIEKFDHGNKATTVRNFDSEENENNFEFNQEDIRKFNFDENEEIGVEKENKNTQNFEPFGNKETDENSKENENLDNHPIKRIIPDELEFTDESDMFDFSSECSQHFESPTVKFTKEEQQRKSIRKSTNVPLGKLKLPDNDESMDEFDLLISSCKPLCERLDDLQKSDVVRTSTPDLLVTPGKKFSFGIDDLLNDTDL